MSLLNHRGIYTATTLEMGIANRDIENVTLEPYQEASTSNIPDTETIRINNDIHFQPREYVPISNLEFDFGSLQFIQPDDEVEDSDDDSYECFFIIDFNDVKVIKWINKRAASIFREWKHDLSEIHKLGGRDVIPEELLHRRDEWEWLCTHFESDKYKRRSVANSSNRGKKELEHHSGRKPIIYRVAELRDKGASLPVVDVYPVTYDINQPKAAEHYVSASEKSRRSTSTSSSSCSRPNNEAMAEIVAARKEAAEAQEKAEKAQKIAEQSAVDYQVLKLQMDQIMARIGLQPMCSPSVLSQQPRDDDDDRGLDTSQISLGNQ
ncbi:hypothetical protein ACLB2K_077046 [Fragaria x ananassa]